jgi:hypothetical protein
MHINGNVGNMSLAINLVIYVLIEQCTTTHLKLDVVRLN